MIPVEFTPPSTHAYPCTATHTPLHALLSRPWLDPYTPAGQATHSPGPPSL